MRLGANYSSILIIGTLLNKCHMGMVITLYISFNILYRNCNDLDCIIDDSGMFSKETKYNYIAFLILLLIEYILLRDIY